jgi:hypothetical protein
LTIQGSRTDTGAKLEHAVQGHEILSMVCSSDRHPFQGIWAQLGAVACG